MASLAECTYFSISFLAWNAAVSGIFLVFAEQLTFVFFLIEFKSISQKGVGSEKIEKKILDFCLRSFRATRTVFFSDGGNIRARS